MRYFQNWNHFRHSYSYSYPPYPMHYAQNPFFTEGFHLANSVPQIYSDGMMPMSPSAESYKVENMHHQLFHNPLQPKAHQPLTNQSYPGYYPYPHKMNMMKPQGGSFGSILNSFKSENGTLDINKMVNTAGQMVNAFNQVSQMAKGLGGIFKV